MSDLPTGTVTFLFTDVEGSTALLAHLGDRYAEVLLEHRRLLRTAIRAMAGKEVAAPGDSCFVAFSRAKDAVAAAVAAQRAITTCSWPAGTAVRVRMGLHTGEPLIVGTDYFGMDVHRAARICAVGHGGQILLSQATCDLVADDLPPGIGLRDLGQHRLRDLAQPQHLFEITAPDLPAEFPPLTSLNFRPNNLPRQLSSFVGREREMTQVKELLSSARLLTLMGAGGSGKTRLALQVAADVLDRYPDGVWIAELASIFDPTLVPQAVATALGVPEQPGRTLTDSLTEALGSKSLLLLLDNCEHLVAACAALAEALLRACPRLQVLATSREALGITGEAWYPVPPLSLPDATGRVSLNDVARYEGIRLFIDRAVESQPNFRITPSNVLAAVHLCHRLDGIPLAIELAAARVKVLSVEQIAVRLDDRFRLLTGGSRTALPRQQTLRAVMDWSYGLLSDDERVVLRRLSVFAGGFALEAAEAVCQGNGAAAGDTLDLLARLVNKSLVLVDQDGGPVRYRLLETVRQYGTSRLVEAGELGAARECHRSLYLALAEEARRFLMGRDEVYWLDRLELEHENLRAALGWVLDTGDAESGTRLAAALGWFWYRRGYWTEGREWCQKALAMTSQAPLSARADALCFAGFLGWAQGDLEPARALLEDGLALHRQVGDSNGVARSQYFLAVMAVIKGEYDRGAVLLEQSLSLFREVGDRWGVAATLRYQGLIALRREEYGRARRLNDESLALYREIGYERGIGHALLDLAQVAYAERRYEETGLLLQESLALFRVVRDAEGIANARTVLANVARKQGDYGQAVALFTDLLISEQPLRAKRHIAQALEGLAAVSAGTGEARRAARLFGAAQALKAATGTATGLLGPNEFDTDIAAAETSLGPAAFAAAWKEGEAMSLDRAIEYGLEAPQVVAG